MHWNKEVDRKLKAHTQKRFNEVYPNVDFVRIFGEDYLREGRNNERTNTRTDYKELATME